MRPSPSCLCPTPFQRLFNAGGVRLPLPLISVMSHPPGGRSQPGRLPVGFHLTHRRCAPSSPLLRKFSFPPTTWSSSSGSARASCENVSMSTSSGGHDPTPPNSSRCCKGQACPRPDFHEATRQIEGLRQRDSHLSNLICEQMCCMCAEHRGGFSGSVFVMRETCA